MTLRHEIELFTLTNRCLQLDDLDRKIEKQNSAVSVRFVKPVDSTVLKYAKHLCPLVRDVRQTLA